jgi:hypothetical protein
MGQALFHYRFPSRATWQENRIRNNFLAQTGARGVKDSGTHHSPIFDNE